MEEIINGINYRLDKDNQTAEVIERRKGIYNDYEGDIIIPEAVVFNGVNYRVTSIGDGAFCGCKSLTDITFQGTIAQWKKITLRDSWKHNIPATVVHCTDGDVEI